MLRQQQAEIEMLKAEMSPNSYDESKNVVNQLFKVKIFRDIDELKIRGNENGFRFHRDQDDKTRYKVYFTDDDVDKLEAFVRQQQAEIKRLIGAEPITYGMLTVCKNCGQQNPYFGKAQEK
jgi:hypothetical protein